MGAGIARSWCAGLAVLLDGFDPPLGRIFPIEGIFPLEAAWVLMPFPQNSDDSINRGLVCAHMHSITQTQKILTFMPTMGEYPQQKHTQHAPSMKMECDYLNGCIKKNSHIRKNLTHNGEPQRSSWATQKKKICLNIICIQFQHTWYTFPFDCINCYLTYHLHTHA